jgi:hypothetical protein
MSDSIIKAYIMTRVTDSSEATNKKMLRKLDDLTRDD